MHPWFAAWRGVARHFNGNRGHHQQHCGGFGRGRCGGDGDGDNGGDAEGSFFGGGGPFGVRRPLRFLAYKLGFDERQVGELAVILDGLKVERAQHELDLRRTNSAYADLLAGEAFDHEAAGKVAADRVASSERLQKAVVAAVAKIHGLLNEEQRKRFVYMLRTGMVRL
jgi:hypothetical protein